MCTVPAAWHITNSVPTGLQSPFCHLNRRITQWSHMPVFCLFLTEFHIKLRICKMFSFTLIDFHPDFMPHKSKSTCVSSNKRTLFIISERNMSLNMERKCTRSADCAPEWFKVIKTNNKWLN